MKLLRLPSKDGPDWWIVTHSFSLKEGWLKNARPIHVFTFVAQCLVSKNKQAVLRLCFALENKIFAVRHNLSRLRSSTAKVGDPICDGKFEKDYDSIQEVIADLEAYLNSIYSVLEIIALLNRNFDRSLPQSFRKQATKYELFSFEHNKWLKVFYDLRGELTHYNTPLPTIEDTCIVVDFKTLLNLSSSKRVRIKYCSLTFSISIVN